MNLAGRFLLDTNIVSYLMADVPHVTAYLQSIRGSHICTSAVTRGEILFGVARMAQGKKRTRFEVAAARVLASLECEPLGAEAANYYAELKRQRFASGRPLEDNDLWIASIAMACGATLVTGDVAFMGTEGLRLVMLTAPGAPANA